MTASNKVFDCLPLLANKVAPNIFDISSGQFHVSLRDQIVRARLLVRDLAVLNPEMKSLMVVGAGAAGIAAAVAAADRGIKVFLLEGGAAPMSLQSGAKRRFVGPFMYEWPWDFSCSQDYPPADPELWTIPMSCPVIVSQEPMAATEFAKQMCLWLDEQLLIYSAHLHFAVNVVPPSLPSYVEYFIALYAFETSQALMGKTAISSLPKFSLFDGEWYGNAPASPSMQPDFIVLAAGMGEEQVSLPKHDGLNPHPSELYIGTPFWKDDNLQERVANDLSVAVVGGGDGALQDSLRALTTFDHPIQMLQSLRGCKHVAALIDGFQQRLQTMEAQGRLLASWTLDPLVWTSLDEKCRNAAKTLATDELIRNRVVQCLRPSKKGAKVFHFVRGSNFDKAYLLNRFLIYLVWEVLAYPGPPTGGARIGFELHFGVEVKGVEALANDLYRVHLNRLVSDATFVTVAEVAIRFGIERGSIPGLKMIQLSENDRGQRSSLSHVPLPFVV